MSLSQAPQLLYHRVYRQLAEEIESGALRPGDRLPSERSLCAELGVSRATVRRALEELAGDGLVESRGRSSFVAGDALVEPANTLISLSELGRSRGLEASARVLAAEVRPATIDEAEAFGIAPGAEVFELRRVRMLDSMAISLDLNRVPLRLVPGLAELDFTRASLYEAIEGAGHALARADYELEARCAEAPVAGLLGLAAGEPVLFATTVACGEDGRVLDLGQTVYRADRYRFQATLTRRVQRRGKSGNAQTIAPGEPAGRTGGRHRGVRRDARGREA